MYLLGHLVMIVENELPIIIEPVEGEVLHPHWCPLIEYLSSRAVNDVSDFVGYHKLQILRRELIS